ncbi:MAG TPA: OmpA family protein [Chlorobiota bacterium]|nr:OmpA family protein [Chlorobiota bacterium]
MRYTLTFCLLTVLSVSQLNGQTRRVFYEDFSSNARQWEVGDGDGIEVEVDDGLIRYERSAESGTTYDWKPVPMEWVRDNWEIQVRVRITDGDENHGASLVYGVADMANLYGVAIAFDGSVQVWRAKEGTYETIQEWTYPKKAKKIGEWNTLRIVKHNDAVAMYVNDEWFYGYNFSYYRWFGNNVGFAVHRNRSVEFDDLAIVASSPNPIRHVAGIDTSQQRTPLPAAINSEYMDLLDGISPDGRTMYISRTGHPANVGTEKKSDVWVTTKDAHGNWQPAVHLGRPINNEGNNFLVTAMPDGNQLYLQNTYNRDGSVGGPGISLSKREGSTWTLPVAQKIEDYENLSGSTTSYIAPDGLTLISSVQRQEGMGSLDLFVSKRQEDGSWSRPVSLGSTINTVGADYGPFIAADNTTMIFSSNGHPGHGGVDLYVTRRLDDTWTSWSEPENLGKPINSDDHDAYFMIPTVGDIGYFNSKEGDREMDIYSIRVPSGALPRTTLIVRGRVFDAKTSKPIAADIIYERLESGVREGEATSNPSDGAYSVALSGKVAYTIRAVAQGYYALSESVDLSSTSGEVTRDLFLVPIVKDAVIRLNNIFFDSGSWDIKPESMPEIRRLADVLRDNVNVEIELAGHTDDVGNDAANLTLSQNRVNAVMKSLIDLGIVANRLTAKGYGETRPSVPNTSDENRKQNRRVEFRVVKD